MKTIGSYIGRQSLSVQLSLAAFLATTVVAAGVFILTTQLQSKVLFEDLHEDAERTIQFLASTSLEAVIVEDVPAIETIIEQTRGIDPLIHSMQYVNEDGKVLANSDGGKDIHTHPTLSLSFMSDQQLLTKSHDISASGEKFGTLSVTWHTGAVSKAISSNLPMVLSMIGASLLLLTAALIAAVHLFVMRPVAAINRSLLSLSSDGAGTPEEAASYVSQDIRALNEAVERLDTQVTERRRAELAMQTSEARLRAILDGSPAAITMKDREGRYLALNNTYAKWANTDTNSVLWRTFDEFADPAVAKRIAAADEHVFTTGEPDIIDIAFLWPDGNTRQTLIYKTPVRKKTGEVEGVATTALDITERKQAEQKIREFNEKLEGLVAERTEALDASERRFRHALEEAPIAIALVDLEGRRFKVNQAMANFLGYTIDELTGSRLTDTIVYPEDLERGAAFRKQLLDGEIDRFRNETRYRHKKGHIVWGEVNVGLVRVSATIPLHFIIHVVDITERKQAEVQRQEAEAQLIQADKLATLGTLAAGTAHELSQPLNIIRLISDSATMGLDENLPTVPVGHDDLRVITEQVGRMAQIIDQMNVFSRKDDVSAGIFSPASAVRRVVSLIEKQFAAGGVTLSCDIQEPCGAVAGLDGQLGQVILNLLTNARDAVTGRAVTEGDSFEGRINLQVTTDEIGGQVFISVMDNGGGVDAEVFKNLFDPFFTTKEVGLGTGLGLSVSHSIIEGMGGSVVAANVPGGACFQVTLPCVDQKPAAAEAAVIDLPVTPAVPVAAPEGSKCSVMIVDDEEQAILVLARTMRRRGYEVITAGNGVEALAAFQAQPTDVVITDIQMPQMDGETLIGHLREISPDLPIFVTTGKMFAENESTDVVNAPGVHLIKKPIDLSEVTKMIDEIMVA